MAWTKSRFTWCNLFKNIHLTFFHLCCNRFQRLLVHGKKNPSSLGEKRVRNWSDCHFYFIFQTLWNVYLFYNNLSLWVLMPVCWKDWCLSCLQLSWNTLFQLAVNSWDFRKKLVWNISNRVSNLHLGRDEESLCLCKGNLGLFSLWLWRNWLFCLCDIHI